MTEIMPAPPKIHFTVLRALPFRSELFVEILLPIFFVDQV